MADLIRTAILFSLALFALECFWTAYVLYREASNAD